MEARRHEFSKTRDDKPNLAATRAQEVEIDHAEVARLQQQEVNERARDARERKKDKAPHKGLQWAGAVLSWLVVAAIAFWLVATFLFSIGVDIGVVEPYQGEPIREDAPYWMGGYGR